MATAVKTKEAIFYVNEISLLYTVAGLCAPLERMKERPGNAFRKKDCYDFTVPATQRSGLSQAFTTCLCLVWQFQ